MEENLSGLIQQQNVRKVKRILKSGGVRINAQNSKGQTLLMYAVYNGFGYPGSIKIAQALLANGANPHLKTNEGETAFSYALNTEKNDEIVGLLLNYSPVPAKYDMRKAVQNKYDQAIQYMLAYDHGRYGVKSLKVAVENRDPQTVRALLQRGVADARFDNKPAVSDKLFVETIRRNDVATYQALVEGAAEKGMRHSEMLQLFATSLPATTQAEEARLRMLEISVKHAEKEDLARALFYICSANITPGPSYFVINGVQLLLQNQASLNYFYSFGPKSECMVTPFELCQFKKQERAADLIRNAGGKSTAEINPRKHSPLKNSSCREQLNAETFW